MEQPKRKRIRIKDYEYSAPGAYFITVCTKDRAPILSHIVGEGLCALPSIVLTDHGKIVEDAILFIPSHYDNVTVDKYAIMPDHIHLILTIHAGGDGTPPLRTYDIIARMKSFTTTKCGKPIWQRSFYDHIIRNEKDYREILQYIENNPLKYLLEKMP